MLPNWALALAAPRRSSRPVHDVVVVERGEVGQLDHGGGPDHVRPGAAAQLAGQDGEQRAEPLATGRHQVPGRVAEGRVHLADRAAEQLLDVVQAAPQRGLEGRVVRGQRSRW